MFGAMFIATLSCCTTQRLIIIYQEVCMIVVAGSCSSVCLKGVFFHELATVACSNDILSIHVSCLKYNMLCMYSGYCKYDVNMM